MYCIFKGGVLSKGGALDDKHRFSILVDCLWASLVGYLNMSSRATPIDTLAAKFGDSLNYLLIYLIKITN